MNEKDVETRIAKMVGEYFFHARQGDNLLKADWIPEDLPEDIKIELEVTYSFIDSLVKLRRIEQRGKHSKIDKLAREKAEKKGKRNAVV